MADVTYENESDVPPVTFFYFGKNRMVSQPPPFFSRCRHFPFLKIFLIIVIGLPKPGKAHTVFY
jgi:hypothetical protein